MKDAIKRAKSQLPAGPSLESCAECGAKIPEARREAIPGVRLCVTCQEAKDREAKHNSGYNRRGSKDSQLRIGPPRDRHRFAGSATRFSFTNVPFSNLKHRFW